MLIVFFAKLDFINMLWRSYLQATCNTALSGFSAIFEHFTEFIIVDNPKYIAWLAIKLKADLHQRVESDTTDFSCPNP